MTARDETPLVIMAAGEHGLLVEVGSTDRVRRLTRWVHDQPSGARLDEVVPAVSTVLLAGPAEVLHWFAVTLPTIELPAATVGAGAGRTVEIPVVYDGDDLSEVAERSGCEVAELITRHRDTTHVVAYFGFSPGQAFLTGLPSVLRHPRRDSPRTRVPPGSLGIANEFSTIYPQASPGGWHLIGRHVGPPLWDVGATPPNQLQVGDRVVFREAR